MSQHLKRVYDAWDGNAEAMAADIGELGVTVRQWRNRGKIDQSKWPRIIREAWEKRGVKLYPSDFLPPEDISQIPHLQMADHESGDSDPLHSASATNAGENIRSAEAEAA